MSKPLFLNLPYSDLSTLVLETCMQLESPKCWYISKSLLWTHCNVQIVDLHFVQSLCRWTWHHSCGMTIVFMLCYYVIYLITCALTQIDSLLHPSKEIFGIATPHLGILECCLDSILTATEGQVCFLGWDGVHQHHCRLHTLGAVPSNHTVCIGVHPAACVSRRTPTAPDPKEILICSSVTDLRTQIWSS